MDNYETGIYTDNPDDTLRYMQTTQPVDLWGYPKQEQDLVEVVRCKDCKWWKREENQVGEIGEDYFCAFDCNKSYRDDFFCADGERRSE